MCKDHPSKEVEYFDFIHGEFLCLKCCFEKKVEKEKTKEVSYEHLLENSQKVLAKLQ